MITFYGSCRGASEGGSDGEEKDRKYSEIKFQEVEKVNARVKVCGAEYISPGVERAWPGGMRWRGSVGVTEERKRERSTGTVGSTTKAPCVLWSWYSSRSHQGRMLNNIWCGSSSRSGRSSSLCGWKERVKES